MLLQHFILLVNFGDVELQSLDWPRRRLKDMNPKRVNNKCQPANAPKLLVTLGSIVFFEVPN